jgi:hypothetical protein
MTIKIYKYSYGIYSAKQNLEDLEITSNSTLLFPFLNAVANTVNESVENTGVEFKTDEAPLKSMMMQLDDKDESNLYKADGIIKLNDMDEIEVLLLEISSHFGCKENSKICFDHHKGLFCGLSMLKTIADSSYLGSVDAFSKIKILFIHAAIIVCRLFKYTLKH